MSLCTSWMDYLIADSLLEVDFDMDVSCLLIADNACAWQ